MIILLIVSDSNMIKYIILFVLFGFVICNINKCIRLDSGQIFGSHIGYEFSHMVDHNLTVRSVNDKTFLIKIFSNDGNIVKFKTRRLEYVNKFSYVEIINTSKSNNEIEIGVSKLNEDCDRFNSRTDMFEEFFSHFSLFVMITLLIFGDKSIYCKILLLVMIGIEICYYDNVYLGDKFRINILKIK